VGWAGHKRGPQRWGRVSYRRRISAALTCDTIRCCFSSIQCPMERSGFCFWGPIGRLHVVVPLQLYALVFQTYSKISDETRSRGSLARFLTVRHAQKAAAPLCDAHPPGAVPHRRVPSSRDCHRYGSPSPSPGTCHTPAALLTVAFPSHPAMAILPAPRSDGGSPLIVAPAGAAATPPASTLPADGSSLTEATVVPAGADATPPVERQAADLERYNTLIATAEDFAAGWPQPAPSSSSPAPLDGPAGSGAMSGASK